MIRKSLIEQVKNQVVVLTDILTEGTLPKIELTEGQSEEGGRMWNGTQYDKDGKISGKWVNGTWIKQ